MTAPLRTTQFFSGHVSAVSTWTGLYTVDSTHRIIVESLAIVNKASVANNVYFSIGGTIVVVSFALGPNGAGTGQVQWRGWIVLGASQVLEVFQQQSAGIDVVVSGKLHYI